MRQDFEDLPPFVQSLWAEAAAKRQAYLAMLAEDRRRKERIVYAIAGVITFFAAPFIIAYWALWGRGKKS